MSTFNHPIALVYCKDNQDTALALEQSLQSSFSFQHYSCCRDEQISLYELLKGFSGPILVLVSDNFLRTSQCIKNGQRMLNEHGDNILGITIDGYRLNERGERELVATNFSRFKEIIQYINYWQNRYLELRKQKRQDPELDNEGFKNYVNDIRDIAGEVAQYLRHLQGLSQLDLAAFQADHYQAFFEFLDEEELWESFAQQATSNDSTTTENTVEDTPIDIQTIPGMDLLNDTATETTEATSVVENSRETAQEENASIDAEQIIKQAWALDAKGEKEQALALLQKESSTHPQHYSLAYNFIVLLAHHRLYAAAEAACNDLLQNSEHHQEALFLSAEIAHFQGKTEEAITYLKQLVASNDTYPNVYYQLARLQEQVQPLDTDLVLSYYKKAIDKNKNNSEAYYHLGLLYAHEVKAPKKAIKQFKKAINVQAQHPLAHYDLAHLLHQEAAYEKAQKHYQKAIAINPDLQSEEKDQFFDAQINQAVNKDQMIVQLQAQIEALQSQLADLKNK